MPSTRASRRAGRMGRLGLAQTVKVVGPEAAEKRKQDLEKDNKKPKSTKAGKKRTGTTAGSPTATPARSAKAANATRSKSTGSRGPATAPSSSRATGQPRRKEASIRSVPNTALLAVLQHVDLHTLTELTAGARRARTEPNRMRDAAATRPLVAIEALCDYERRRRAVDDGRVSSK